MLLSKQGDYHQRRTVEKYLIITAHQIKNKTSNEESNHRKSLKTLTLPRMGRGLDVPLNYAPIFKRFLSLPNHHIRCRVTGKRVNRGGGFGLEVPVDYIFFGDKKAIKWLASRISSIDKALDEQLKKCLK